MLVTHVLSVDGKPLGSVGGGGEGGRGEQEVSIVMLEVEFHDQYMEAGTLPDSNALM